MESLQIGIDSSGGIDRKRSDNSEIRERERAGRKQKTYILRPGESVDLSHHSTYGVHASSGCPAIRGGVATLLKDSRGHYRALASVLTTMLTRTFVGSPQWSNLAPKVPGKSRVAMIRRRPGCREPRGDDFIFTCCAPHPLRKPFDRGASQIWHDLRGAERRM